MPTDDWVPCPTLKPDEEIVGFRYRCSDGKIVVNPGEIVVSYPDGKRIPYKHSSIRKNKGLFSGNNGGRGRWIVRKKTTATQGGAMPRERWNPNVEVFSEYCRRTGCSDYTEYSTYSFSYQEGTTPKMAEQKPLKYKTSTLIKCLEAAIQKNEDDRKEAAEKLASLNEAKIEQILKLIEEFPTFARDVVAWVEAYMSGSGKVGSEAFKENVIERYTPADKPEEEFEHDAELKKLVRVFKQAEDETVEVHVHDSVYNYL